MTMHEKGDAWVLSGPLFVTNAPSVRAEMIGILNAEVPKTLHIAALEDFDAVGLQLLIAFRIAGGAISTAGCSEGLRQRLEQAGAWELLQQ